MENNLTFEITANASTPKYKQIVASIISRIEMGKIKFGQKLPSINQFSFDYLIARDTVEKAYKELRELGVIESVKGKGYFVKNSNPKSKLRVLVIFSKLSSHKQMIYHSMSQLAGEKAELDLFIYHCNYELFERLLSERIMGYHYYVMMLHFKEYKVNDLQELLKKIKKEKIILLDNNIEGIIHYSGMVYQDFKMDIYYALVEAKDLLQKHNKLVLVFPVNRDYPYPKEIINGFRRFCSFHLVTYEIIPEVTPDYKLLKNTAYITIEELDLINLIKIVRNQKLKLGKELGILSYNDSPLKEILESGISVITTDFEEMGALTARMITSGEPVKVKNDFKLIVRGSI